MPADDVPGSTHVLEWPERRLVLFGSGAWEPVRVRAWSTDRLGRTVAAIEWYADGATWQESYLADMERIRETPG